MKPFNALLLSLGLCAALTAHAQYSWVDKNGRRVFSDQPPPAGVTVERMKRPGGQSMVPSTPTAAQPAASAVLAAPAAGSDKALEENKRKAEAAEAARQKAEQERQAAARAENCRRARQSKATLDSGIRVARVNEKGERIILDDAQRQTELQAANQAIASECN